MRPRIVVTLSMLVLAGLGASPAFADGVQPSAADTLSACLQTNDRISVLFLIDESGSIKVTDPTAARVEGLRDAIAGLEGLAGTLTNGRQPKVEVLFAGFSDHFYPDPNSAGVSSDWHAVTPATIGSLDLQAGAYANRDRSTGTDYGTAILDARQLLATRAADLTQHGGQDCTALVLFTDGGYDLGGRQAVGLGPTVSYAPSVNLYTPTGLVRGVKAGVQFMCRPGGLMDGLASDGVVNFTIGLNPTPPDGAFLQAFTTGAGPGQRCGSRLSLATGTYIDVRDASRLFFAFSDLLDGSMPTQTTHTVCRSQPCTRGFGSFRTFAGLNRFLIRTTTGEPSDRKPAIDILLTGPDGGHAKLTPGVDAQLAIDGAMINATWVSPTAVDMVGELPATQSQWIGGWSFAYLDPSGTDPAAVPVSTVQLFPAIAPRLQGNPSILRGGTSSLAFELADAAGALAPSGPLLSSVRISASATDPSGGPQTSLNVTRAPGAPSRFQAAVSLPASSQASEVRVDVTMSFALADGSAVIVPEHTTFTVPTRLPEREGFPTISPAELLLPSVSGHGSTRGVITVTASRDASGCVWIGDTSLAAPAGAGTVGITTAPAGRSRAACLHLAPSQVRRLDVRFSVRRGQSGTVRATLPLVVTSAITPGTRATTVDASFAVSPTPNVAKRVLIVVLLTLLGALVPVAALCALNWFGARFRELESLLFVASDACVRPDGELAAPDGNPIDISPAEFRVVAAEQPRDSKRVLWLDGGRFRFYTRALGGRGERRPSLVLGPYAVVETDTGAAIAMAAGSTLNAFEKVGRHEVPLALASTWVFDPYPPHEGPRDDDPFLEESVDNDDASQQPITGRLLLIIRSHDDSAALLIDAQAELSRRREELVQRGTRAPLVVRYGRLHAILDRRPDSRREGEPAEPAATDVDDIFKPG
jgi:hypothetical protein